ncbi:unnamed protein product, partial [Thlaspi arvense]
AIKKKRHKKVEVSYLKVFTLPSGSRGAIMTITLSLVSAFRTSQMLLKPLVDAMNMEPVVALREQPELFTGNKI